MATYSAIRIDNGQRIELEGDLIIWKNVSVISDASHTNVSQGVTVWNYSIIELT